jgi:predicted amino acid dehydrogenase
MEEVGKTADAPVVLIINTGDRSSAERVQFLGRSVMIETIGCNGDLDEAASLIAAHRDRVSAIGLDGLPAQLELGDARRDYLPGRRLVEASPSTPVVDGSGIRAGLERWGVVLADRAEPGIFAEKSVLMCPGLNHAGLAQALHRRGRRMRYADPVVFLGLPEFPGIETARALEGTAPAILDALHDRPLSRLYPAAPTRQRHGHEHMFERADVIAGNATMIRRFAPDDLGRKTIIVNRVSEDDVEDFRSRGASLLVTMMPTLGEKGTLARHSAAVVEAVLVALRPNRELPLDEDTYLDMIADLDWTPGIAELQEQEAGINRFAFVIHPLSVRMIHAHPLFRWSRVLPDALVEWFAARIPPMYVSRVTGACSPTTGQRVEGYLYTLGATPRQMMKLGERITYDKLHQVVLRAQRRGARIVGLGAFTSVVGDAGKTVAHESDIAITSGNSLTVAATLEAAKEAVVRMGADDLTHGRAMIVGATGSIGAVCARLIAQAVKDVVLISIEPERLIELKRRICEETPGARVVIGTRASDHLPECDLVITATSAFGQRVVDLSQCKPGAVVCDVARPHDISAQEAAVRPDVLVIDSGEVLIPGDIDFGYDIGLPPGVSYACLAETCLLAMDGRFEDYTIGRELEMERVKDIYHLFQKHRFRIAGLHSFDEDVTDEKLAEKRALADRLRADPALLASTMAEAAERIAGIPVAAKGVGARRRRTWLSESLMRPLLHLLGRRQAWRD